MDKKQYLQYLRHIKNVGFIGKSEGLSMMPLIHPDSDIYVRPTTFSRLNINDIVTFQKTDKLISHRIVYKNKRYIITKGDSKLQSDGKIYPKQVIGKVHQIKWNGRTIDINNYNSSQSTCFFQEAARINKIFESVSIDFVFLEGPPVYAHFKNTDSMKMYSESDILVRKKDFNLAEIALIDSGYKKINGRSTITCSAYSKVVHNTFIIITLHFELSFQMTMQSRFEALYPHKYVQQLTEELLSEKHTVKIKSHYFDVLSPNNYILYLALQIFHSNFRGVHYYHSLDLAIRKTFQKKQNKEYIWLNNTIAIYQLQGFLSPVFYLLIKYYRTPFPQDVIRQLNPSFFSDIDIFSDESYLRAQINHFRWIFILSPNRKKRWIMFVTLDFWNECFWMFWKKLIKESSAYQKNVNTGTHLNKTKCICN